MPSRRKGPTIGETLRTLRQQKGWTLDEAAKRSGIPRTTLLSYETGHTQVPADRLKILADLYEVSVDSLLEELQKKKDASEELAREHPEYFRILTRAAKELPPERFDQLLKFIELFVEWGGRMPSFDWQAEIGKAQRVVQGRDNNPGEDRR
ncbi:MAG: helix-turn-helix domain-containing protein [Moorellales bacterium]